MQLTTDIKLVKKFDEHECRLEWNSNAPVFFLLNCMEDFKNFLDDELKKIKEREAQKEPESK